MRISDWSSDVCSSDLCPRPDSHRTEMAQSRLSAFIRDHRIGGAQPTAMVAVERVRSEEQIVVFNLRGLAFFGSQMRSVDLAVQGRVHMNVDFGLAILLLLYL